MATPTIPQLFDLTGKAAIVTGGGKGIGQASALRLAEAGAQILVMDIDQESADQTVEQIKAQGGKARAVKADAASTANAERVVKACMDSFGRIDILVNNAGIYPPSPALETTEELWDRVLDVNLKGMFFYSQAAAREMIKAGNGGKIINIASTDSIHAHAGAVPYNASKGGVLMLTKGLALEWAPHNILINAIAPGGIPTPGMFEHRDIIAAAMNIDGDELMKRRIPRQPLGHLGTPDEIAKTVLFLAGGASDYITGTLILVDGGYLLT